MPRLNWASTKRAFAILIVILLAMLLVYFSLTSSCPSPIDIMTIPPRSRTLSNPYLEPYSEDPARPVQPPVLPAIYVKDIYEGGYQMPHPEICPSLGVNLKVLILITSAPDHAGPREAVRLTWGHFSRRSDLAIAFVLGSPPDDLKESLIEEDGLYRDLIIGNNIDSYNNMSLKTISMLEWASKYCPRAPYILKTDDDVFINIPQLLNFLQQPSVLNANKVIWGRKISGHVPRRQRLHKHYLSSAQFAGRVLPDYCVGPAYLMTGDCILPLLKAAPGLIYLRLEDVFITGILARIVGIERRHASWFYNYHFYGSCRVRSGISIHEVRPYVQYELWRKLLDNRLTCWTPASKRPTAIATPTHLSRNRTSSGK